MKNLTTIKSFSFILLMSGMLACAAGNAQNCSGNKIRVYRCDHCRNKNSKCINPGQLNNALANGWQLQWCNPCWVRLRNPESNESEPLKVYPNPFSNTAFISFGLEESQKVSIRIFDVSGRLVSTLTDKIFDEGENELTWNTEGVNSGIYFLLYQSGEKYERKKLIVTKE